MAEQTLHGVNLAGWLVPEAWVTPALFSESGATDEASLMERLGPERYEEVLGKHMDSFVDEVDFARMQARGINAVRIPVPWYVFGDAGPMPMGRTGCCRQLDRAFDWAEDHGIQVLLDVASAPLSGYTQDGLQIRLAPSLEVRTALLDVVTALAVRYGDRRSLLGIEPLDEVQVRRRQGLRMGEGVALSFLRNFYRDAYDVIREAAGPDPVVVLSDGGMPGSWRAFMSHGRYQNVWLDCHLYHHLDTAPAGGPSGARWFVGESRKQLEVARKSGLPVMVGEWSAAMPGTSTSITPEGRIALARVYTSGQLNCFEKCPAWFFQTWKTATLDPAWDARVALSSFDRDMLD